MSPDVRAPSSPSAEVELVEASIEELGRLSVPHYLRLPTLVLWVASPALAGAFATAPQPLSELERVQQLYVRLYEPPNARALYTDLRAFDAEREMLAAILEGASSRVVGARPTRISLVVGDGWLRAWWIGVVAMGVFAGGPTRAFADPAEAWDWVDAPESVRLAIDALQTRLSSGGGVRTQLDELLRLEPGLTLERAARKLGLSPRSLQRLLRSGRERFADLRDRSRAETAALRLARSDDKIDVVAADTGFRSRSHFVTWFRRLTGTSPADFRARHRAR